MSDLTKCTEKVLCTLYKEYLVRCKNGASKSDARMFNCSSSVQPLLFPKMILDDFDDALLELSRSDYVTACFEDNTVSYFDLTTKAISHMENRFKNGLKEVADFISQLTDFIP